eukprot:1045653-Pleurochrysis_carterae.AAC.1
MALATCILCTGAPKSATTKQQSSNERSSAAEADEKHGVHGAWRASECARVPRAGGLGVGPRPISATQESTGRTMATALYAAARRRFAGAWPMHATATGTNEVMPLAGPSSDTYHLARLQRGICAWIANRGSLSIQHSPCLARASPSLTGHGQHFAALPNTVFVGGVRCLPSLAAPPAPVLTEEQIRNSANPTGALMYKARNSGGEKSRRLNAAWDACRRGEPFEMPDPPLALFPGPCGAVMNILRDVGPCTVLRLWDLCQAHALENGCRIGLFCVGSCLHA